jgi:hypothetical protein
LQKSLPALLDLLGFIPRSTGTAYPSPAYLSPASDLTGTFQGQLFHRRFASTGSYTPRARGLPVQATEVLAPSWAPSPHSTVALRDTRPKCSGVAGYP